MERLSPADLRLLERKLSEMEVGIELELEQIFGSDWDQIENPTKFGKEFKVIVLNQGFENIEFIKINSNNHNVYLRTI